MDKNQEWDEFLDQMLSKAIDEFRKTEEYELIKEKQDRTDEWLANELTADQKRNVDDVLFESGLYIGRETQIAYRQGFKDCVWLFKKLKVFA